MNMKRTKYTKDQILTKAKALDKKLEADGYDKEARYDNVLDFVDHAYLKGHLNYNEFSQVADQMRSLILSSGEEEWNIKQAVKEQLVCCKELGCTVEGREIVNGKYRVDVTKLYECTSQRQLEHLLHDIKHHIKDEERKGVLV